MMFHIIFLHVKEDYSFAVHNVCSSYLKLCFYEIINSKYFWVKNILEVFPSQKICCINAVYSKMLWVEILEINYKICH